MSDAAIRSPVSSPGRAALWMSGAVCSFSLMAIGGRETIGAVDTFELMLLRSLVGFVIVVSFGLATRRMAEIRTNRLGAHAARNLFHFTAQNLWFYAVALIPLAQLFAIEFTTPIWIALLAPLLLGEALTRWRVLASLLGFCGILVVTQPGAAVLNVGHLTAALSTLGFCGSIMMTKALSRTESTFCILFWLCTIQAVYGAVAVGWDGAVTIPEARVWPWAILVGVCGLSAHVCLTTALKLAPASVVAPMDFARLPLIAVVGWLAYSEALDPAVAIGGALILTANTINLRAERRRARAGGIA